MKIFKRIAIAAAGAMFLLSLGALAACGTDPQTPQDQNGGTTAETVTYTATVLDPTGSPIEGLQVKWGTSDKTFLTLESGTAKADLPAGEYDISVEGFLPIYKYTVVKTTKDDRDKTIRLEWNPEDGKVVYTVKVVYPNGDPVEGVSVGLCDETNCTNLPLPTNAQGETYSIGVINAQMKLYQRGLTPQEYEVQIISGIPEDYEVELNEKNHYANDKATADKHTVTVTLKEKTA